MNLKEIEKQLYTDKYLDEKKYYIYALMSSYYLM